MARFNEAWMETLLTKNDIVSLVSDYVSLKVKGRKHWGLCPFHNEKTPSFSVSEDKQLYYCFGCGVGGGLIQFVMDIERLPYVEAVEFLAHRVGMELPEELDDASLQQERAHRERLYAACAAAGRYFYKQLLGDAGAAARKYLAQRGLDAGIVQQFALGYAPDSWDSLSKHLKSEGFKEDDLVDAGLLVRNARTGNVYDAYRNRVVFPIIGSNGRVLGFGARTMGEDLPKYINTGDTPIYSKRHNLYALHLLRNAKAADAVMVEGYMDVISLHAAGINNAVASLGTSLTEQQAKLLKRYVQTVYIAYDGDAAGQNATLRGLDILSREGLRVRVIQLPDKTDPDDFVRKQKKEGFLRLKDQALALNAFKLKQMAAGYDLTTEDGRQEYALAGCKFISALQPVEQERYYAALAQSTGLSMEALQAQGKRAGISIQTSGFGEARRSGSRGRRTDGATDREQVSLLLLRAMLQSADAARLVQESGAALDTLFEGGLLELVHSLIALYERGAKPDIGLLLSGLDPEQAQVIAGMLESEEVPEQTLQFAKDCVNRICSMDVEAEIRALRLELEKEELPLAQKLEMAQRLQELDNQRRDLQ